VTFSYCGKNLPLRWQGFRDSWGSPGIQRLRPAACPARLDAALSARARGVKLGRQHGQRPSDKKAKRVLAMHREGLSYRLIGRYLGLSKNTVMEIVRRETALAV
jgi:hypothetical protein